MSNLSQEARVMQMLRKAGSRGVENYQFPKHGILRYSARIGELRKDYNILAERVYAHGRWTGVWKYILIEES